MDSGPAEKKPVRIAIFGQSYTVRTSGDPREVEDLARLIDDLMTGIASRTGDSEPSRVAVLACLHVSDRLRAVERELAGLKQRVQSKSSEFSLLLDQALRGPGE